MGGIITSQIQYIHSDCHSPKHGWYYYQSNPAKFIVIVTVPNMGGIIPSQI